MFVLGQIHLLRHRDVPFSRVIGSLVLALLLSFCTGCSRGAEPSAAKTVTYTDMAGRRVTLPANVRRIVLCRTLDIYKLAAILGDELDAKLIGVGIDFAQCDSDGYRKFSEVFTNLDRIANVGSIYNGTLSLEHILKLAPDIVIAEKYFYDRNDHSGLQKIIEAGLPLVFMDNDTDPLHGTQASMRMLGKMLGQEERVNEMTDYTNARTDAVLERIARLQAVGEPKPKLYFECGNVSPSEIGVTRGGTNNGWGYLWHKLGADNIGANGQRGQLNPEQVLVSNPDVIVIGGASWKQDGNIMRLGFSATREDASAHLGLYTKRAGWPDLSAIKDGRLHALHFNYFIHPYNFAGVEAMAKFLYPKEFADLDPEKDMAEFFEKYMPVKYSGVFSADWKSKQHAH